MQKTFQQFVVNRLFTHNRIFPVLDFDASEFFCLLYPTSLVSARVVITKVNNPLAGMFTLNRAFPVRTQVPICLKEIHYTIMAMNGDGKSLYENPFKHEFFGNVWFHCEKNEIRSNDGVLFKHEKLNFVLDTKTFDARSSSVQFVA